MDDVMRFYTDDPVADHARYDAEQERLRRKLPVCSECGEHIEDDTLYVINDEIICESCMRNYRRYTEDLIE